MTKPRKTKTVPERGSDEWKTFVADAIGKPVSRRTETEKTEIAFAMMTDKPATQWPTYAPGK